MVTITDYKTFETNEGKTFNTLQVQGGVEIVRSKETNRTYLTAKKASVPCTFDEATCKMLIGTEMPGMVIKREVKPYNYTVPETGEIISLTHSYEFVDENEAILNDNLLSEKKLVV